MTNGTATFGTPAYAAGKFGNALTGGSVYTIGNPESGTTWTVEAWVKTSATNGPLMFAAHEGWWYLAVDGGGAGAGRARCSIGSGYAHNLYGAPINDGAWHHVAIVMNAGTATIFTDGASGDTFSMADTFGDTTKQTTIGGLTSAGGYAFTGGQIDEVRISRTARYTASFTAPTAAFTDDSNTIALYHLEADATDAHSSTDTTAPSTPTGLVATPGNAQVALSWTASTDNVAVTGYKVRRGGTVVGTPAGVSYTDTGLTNGTTYSYTVSAVDAAGNESPQTTALTATPAAAGATTTIPVTDAGLIFSPFNWNIASGVASTINPGAYFRCAVAGATGVTLNFDTTGVSTPVPKLKVRIDDGPWVGYDYAATITPMLPTTNAWTVHQIEVVVQSTSEFVNRWNPQNAIVKFTGLTLTGSATTRTAVPLGKNVLIYGDSITEGYKTSLNVQTPDGSDATVAWSYLQRHLLGCEVGVVGFGAQGWVNGGQGGVPALPNAWNLIYYGVARSFTAVVPDLIVINMGQNDSTDITNLALSFLNTLLALNTTTKIALMVPFSGVHAAQLQAAIASCTTPSRVTYIDTTGWWNSADSFDGVHPQGVSSQSSLGPRTANALRPLLAGTVTGKRFVNVGGTAKAIA